MLDFIMAFSASLIVTGWVFSPIIPEKTMFFVSNSEYKNKTTAVVFYSLLLVFYSILLVIVS